ncbi:hypothetical protein CRYUN_Cryun19dG0065900 [Craigia yunnanensis]
MTSLALTMEIRLIKRLLPANNQIHNSSGAAAMGQSVKHRAQPHLPSLGMYGAPDVRPVAAPGHIGSAVGTPVMHPPGHHPLPPYIFPVAYPIAPPPMHQ